MPHFILECSEAILINNSPEEIMRKVFESADSTGLFKSDEIKVRITPYMYYTTGNSIRSFMHITTTMLEGRTREQKHGLSREIIIRLEALLPEVSSFSLSFVDLDKETYVSKTTG